MKPSRVGALVVVLATVVAGAFFLGRPTNISPPNPVQPVVSVALPLPPVTIGSAHAPDVLPSAVSSPEPVPDKPSVCPPEPPIELSKREAPKTEAELLRVALEQPESLGSASIGSPTRGFLFGGVELKDSEGILHVGGYPWGTELAIRSIERAVREVRRCFPDTPRLRVGDISRDRGGWLKPHASHQSGLDADIGYYYRTQAVWYEKATAKNLDVARTWALVRAFIEGGNVDTIFIDLTVQRILKAHVATLSKEEQPPEDWFQRPTKKDTVIRHAWGHVTHFHVRFRDPDAASLGQRMWRLWPKIRKPKRRP